MIKEFEFYHGVVFSRLIHASGKNIKIKPYPTSSNSSYVVDENIGVYIKYSSKRMSPWRFSFRKCHQDEISQMRDKLEEVFLVLMCGEDGLVVLSYEELKKILDEDHKSGEWISIYRKPREKYSVKGSDGKLKFKIGENEFPNKLFAKKYKENLISKWFK